MSDVTTGKERECCVDENDGRHENVQCVIRTERWKYLDKKERDARIHSGNRQKEGVLVGWLVGFCRQSTKLTNFPSSQHDYLHRDHLLLTLLLFLFTLYALS